MWNRRPILLINFFSQAVLTVPVVYSGITHLVISKPQCLPHLLWPASMLLFCLPIFRSSQGSKRFGVRSLINNGTGWLNQHSEPVQPSEPTVQVLVVVIYLREVDRMLVYVV